MFQPLNSRLALGGLAGLTMLAVALPLAAHTNSAWFARAWQAEDGLPEHTIPLVQNKMNHSSTLATPARKPPLLVGSWVVYEGRIRVPFLGRGPGIKPGTQCDAPIAGWNISQT